MCIGEYGENVQNEKLKKLQHKNIIYFIYSEQISMLIQSLPANILAIPR